MRVLAKIILALALLVLSIPALLFGALWLGELFPSSPRYDVFDDGEILVEVMTRTEEGAVQYYALADGQRIRETAPFEPEPMTVYDVVFFQALNWRTDKKPSFVPLCLMDEAGSAVPLTEELRAVLKQLEAVDHRILSVKVMTAQERLFVWTELNVNLWDPCVLYQYGPDTQTLTELYTWDGEEPVGLRVHSGSTDSAAVP